MPGSSSPAAEPAGSVHSANPHTRRRWVAWCAAMALLVVVLLWQVMPTHARLVGTWSFPMLTLLPDGTFEYTQTSDFTSARGVWSVRGFTLQLEVLEARSVLDGEADYHRASDFRSLTVLRVGAGRLLVDGGMLRRSGDASGLLAGAWRQPDWPQAPRRPHPFYRAVRQRDVVSARGLLEKDPGLAGAPDYSGATPLAHAVWNADHDMIELLFEYGADPNGTNAHGIPALAIALHNRGEEAAASLLRQLVEHGADINRQAPDGGTALHMAARSGHRVLYDRLLELGADPGLKCRSGETAADMLRARSDATR